MTLLTVVTIPGNEQAITFISAHLCPNGREVRRRKVAYLAVQAAPERLTLIAGDFIRPRAGRLGRPGTTEI
jgi:exodeoxyribonuclease-3